jgi:hypothetical protein
MWTGTLLGAFAHAYVVESAPAADPLLPIIRSILQGYNFSTSACHSSNGYIPRTWALPVAGSAKEPHEDLPSDLSSDLPWIAWRNYFSPSPPYINGSGSHGVFSCVGSGAKGWLWQGDASRDTYIGTLFGLGSTMLALKDKHAASAEYALAKEVFERVFDKLAADRFFILPPKECQPVKSCPPVNPTPTFAAAFLRVALSVNPTKYSEHAKTYTFWLNSAIASEAVTPVHHSAYYGNNLLAESWYVPCPLSLSSFLRLAAVHSN